LLLISLFLSTAIPSGYAVQCSIPINGHYGTWVIRMQIPTNPRWAHDVVLNAIVGWNRAQAWYLRSNSSAPRYLFVEANDGTATATVRFTMPKAYAAIAVGWTNHIYRRGSKSLITSTQTYLDPTIFNHAEVR
jgi:hypothetical protein